LAIRANGDIDPCVFFPRTLGNALRDDLEHLWAEEPLLKALRDKDILKGNCGSCEYRYQCGGCRARALGYLGDPMAPDPGCINNIAVYENLLTAPGR
jgi:radical SAM protein with 4Fe4S-binding SPASM domain